MKSTFIGISGAAVLGLVVAACGSAEPAGEPGENLGTAQEALTARGFCQVSLQGGVWKETGTCFANVSGTCRASSSAACVAGKASSDRSTYCGVPSDLVACTVTY